MSHLKKLVDFSDPEEVTLYNALLESYHAFLKYKMTKINRDFPTDVRYDDTWRYMYFANGDTNLGDAKPESKEIETEPEDKQPSSSNRRKLALLFHPDKCPEPDARQLFEFVWNTDEETITTIINSDDPISKIREKIKVDVPVRDSSKESEIDTWMNGMSYTWFCNKKSFISEKLYLEKKEISQKCFELRVANDALREKAFEYELKNLCKKYK